MKTLKEALIDLCRHGKARCGSGFGKYPLGIRDAVIDLLPLVAEHERAEVQQTLDELHRRLEQ